MKGFIVVLLGLITFGISANATTIDTTKVESGWTAYKTVDKVPVGGTFDDIVYKFGKKNDSIASTLEGATATINPMKVNLHDETKNSNMKNYFFSHFKKGSIKVTFQKVMEGKDKGTILAAVKMNGKDVKVPMEYTIVDGKLMAIGTLDLLEFSLNDAFSKLVKGCYDFHEGMTWSQVAIHFSASIK